MRIMQIFFKKLRNITSLLIIVGCLVSCEDIFQYSPYDAPVTDCNVNEKNIQQLSTCQPADTLWFITIADVHHSYDELTDAIKKINTQNYISFVAVCGDVTDEGLASEFQWYNHIMNNLDIPYITIIGNHDYRSNGRIVYEKMFGQTNFTFDIVGYHFIGFDDVVWENGNRQPDFAWLNNSLKETSHSIQVVFAHIPPWTDQLDLDLIKLETLIKKNPDHVLVIHGHEHNYCYKQLHAQHIVTGSLEDNEMCLIGLCDTSFTLQRISF